MDSSPTNNPTTASLAEELGLTYKVHSYGSHNLQRIGVWEFADSQSQSSGRWVIFVHGGAWRDPRNTHEDFWPSIKHIVSEARPSLDIRGFVSIDYRLSPHPDHRDETNDSNSQRTAKHPDHVQDVFNALAFLKKEFALGSDYVLIGHSAGATLAFQLFMDELTGRDLLLPEIPQPAAIIGISGIYDLVGLNERHDNNYSRFISDAFGSDADDWRKASPATFEGDFSKTWANGKFAILAWSREDSLIDEPEIANMQERLSKDSIEVVVDKDLKGEHDFVWQDGSQVSRLVSATLEKL